MITGSEQQKSEAVSGDVVAGRRVHMLMWDAKLSQRRLAPKLGMTQANLSKKVRGERGWSIDELFAVARELGTTVSYLIGETENRRPDGPDGGSVATYTPRDSNPEPTD